MYEFPMGLDPIPNLQFVEGAALVRDLTGLLTIWAVLFAMVFLVLIPPVYRDAGPSHVLDDAQQPDGDARPDSALRRAA
jgi:hypothetical protein